MSRPVSLNIACRNGDGSSGGEVEYRALPGALAEVERGGQRADDGGHIEVDTAGVRVAPATEHPPRQRQREHGRGTGEVVGEVGGGDATPVEAFALGMDRYGIAGTGVGTGDGMDGKPAVRDRESGGHRDQPPCVSVACWVWSFMLPPVASRDGYARVWRAVPQGELGRGVRSVRQAATRRPSRAHAMADDRRRG